jgi:hypothetical protein
MKFAEPTKPHRKSGGGGPGVSWFGESPENGHWFLFRGLKLSGADVLLRRIVRRKLTLGM